MRDMPRFWNAIYGRTKQIEEVGYVWYVESGKIHTLKRIWKIIMVTKEGGKFSKNFITEKTGSVMFIKRKMYTLNFL